MSQTLHTCRFCQKANYQDSRPFIKYGLRHWACQPCYLDHKSLDDLSDWQVGTLSFRLLKERGLLHVAERRCSALTE
jgi:hypothetical protein